jgi:hypothetical protein
MTIVRNIALVCLAVASLVSIGCGDEVSAASAKRFCKASCEKTSTCVASPIAVDCDSTCEATSGGSGNTDCDVSSSQVDSCAAAIEAMSCAEFSSGNLPSSCDFCPSNGTPDASGDTSTTFPDVSSGTGTCADLSDCCDSITDPNLKQGCQSTVGLGSDATCSSVLAGFLASGACN